MKIKNVVKSSGITQPFDESKITKVLQFASQQYKNVDINKLLTEIVNRLTDNMTTNEIQRVAIKTVADKISLENQDLQFVSANLEMFALRKHVYGQFEPIPFYDHIVKLVQMGKYDSDLLLLWTKEQIDELETHIKHERDFEFTYAGVQQLLGKYMVQNRVSKEIYETPQYAFMLIAMCLHQDEKTNRVKHVIDFYNAVSNKKLSLPTPIMSGVRTPTRQFSSCVVIETGDSLDSINAVSSAIVKYISQRAGIGVNAGRIRAEGSLIRGGEAYHTGVIPFYKHYQTAVKSCSQGGTRGGSATLFYPIWHLEVENLVVLKNNKGTDENRVRHIDYGIQINEYMYNQLMTNGFITLFSPDVADGKLYDYYFSDSEKFEALYKELSKDPSVRKKRIKAIDIFSMIAQERASTGRIYIFNTDNVNQSGSFNVPVRQSNLCMEIAIPTKPLGKDPSEGEIGLCTLTAFVIANIEEHELQHIARVAVRALDNLLDYQNYPVDSALKALYRRSLGIGVTGYASWLAKNFLDYTKSSLPEVHRLFENIQYCLLRASNELAKERGACEYFHQTRYHDGLTPIDWYKKTVDELVKPVYYCDWDQLTQDILKYGLRNSTLSALMPCESSSQVSNSTNGIEPPRGYVSIKQSKDGVYRQIVPNESDQLSMYDLLWNVAKRGNQDYLSHVAVMQKFTDQSISANTNYDPMNYENGKVPITVILDDMLYAQYYGVKTLYYHNTNDHSGDEDEIEALPECEGCSV